ncbi:uncharacterized protein BDR25DRAFT_210232, partial [Lindgomyces ingoldianus]
LWIHAICINQNDLHERPAQVGFMKEIYNHAASVVIWLGETSPETSLAVSTITAIWNRFTSNTSHQPEQVLGLTRPQTCAEELQVLKTYRNNDISGTPIKEAYEHVATFSSFHWFRGVWDVNLDPIPVGKRTIYISKRIYPNWTQVLQEAFTHTSVTVRLCA